MSVEIPCHNLHPKKEMHCSTSPLKVLTRTVYAFLRLVDVAVRGLRRIQRKIYEGLSDTNIIIMHISLVYKN